MTATFDRFALHGTPGRQRFLEAVLDSAIDYAIIGLDLDGIVIEWSEGARRILGWTADEMIGRHAAAFFSPEDVTDGVPEAEMRGARERGQASDERWHMHRDGTRFYALGEMMPLRDDTGELVGYIKVVRDRTHQRLAEDALREREAFLTSVLSSSGDCIKIIDLDGRLSFMTETGQKVMEVADFGKLCGLAWPTLWESAARGEAEAALVAARAGGAGRFQGSCPTMKGTPKYWDVVVTPIRGADGRVANLLAVSRDITDLKTANEARAAAEAKARFDEELLKAVFRAAPIGISVTDASTGQSLILNDTMQAMLGATVPNEADLARYGGYGAVHADGRPYAPADYPTIRVLANGTPVGWEDMLYRSPGEDDIRHFETSSAPVRDGDGTVVASVTIVVDVESERAAKAEAAKLAALVEQSSDCITIAAPNGRLEYINPAGLALFGLPDLATARETHIASCFAPECRTTITTPAFRAAVERGQWEGELKLETADARTPVMLTAFPLRDEAGAMIAIGGVTRDLTIQKEAEHRQSLLNHELSHRMKNMLAMVQSIAFQTLRAAPSVTAARDTLSARIVALSKAHDLLLGESATAAEMRAIIACAVGPHDEEGSPRFVLDGPALQVGPRAAMALSLMVHELATNAAKYGSLSTPDGRVAISWGVGEDGFRMEWRETGGPRVSAPSKTGFGSRLIERGLAADVGGKVTTTYHPEGLLCMVRASLAALQVGV